MIPSAGTPIICKDILRGIASFFIRRSYISEFERAISDKFGSKYCFSFCSGTAAFYIALKALKQLSDKKEVILPAYTAPHLVLPIWKVGLKPILCDISVSTFNLDIDKLESVITKDTLAVVPVHMFGIPCKLEPILKTARIRDVFVFEDSASSLGAELKGKKVGSIADVSIYSFNRGKNMSTFAGGCVTTNSSDIANAVKKERSKLELPKKIDALALGIKTVILALAVRPLVYTSVYCLISRFKDVLPHSSFSVGRFTDFQAALGLSLLGRLEEFSKKRKDNGFFLYDALRGIESIILPEIAAESEPAFNQFPIVFKDEKLRDKIHRQLIKKGIEATLLYQKPIHALYDLGYSRDVDPFPNASLVANNLLLLPTHPLVSKDKLGIMIKVLEQLK